MAPSDDSLPQATAEVRELGKLYGANSADVFVGAEASERRWKEAAPRYRILHLATHGVLNANNPLFSYLKLGRGTDGAEDGMLEAREILDLDLRAELAVLSACETARGEFRGGEGVVGMSWALMMAGTPTVVVSQWKVESAGTTQLMLALHRNLHRGLSAAPMAGKAEALRRAAMELAADPRYRHPFYWAGFTILGNGY
jgi:CHAT domain-containing protein